MIIGILMPKLTRKEIVFGVRVPEDKTNLQEITTIKRKYIINNLLIEIPVTVLFTFLNYRFFGVGMILFTSFAFIFINFLIYMLSNKHMKDLKKQQNWFNGKKKSVIVDTDFSRERMNTLVSHWFFIIPVIIVVINIALGYSNYSGLPSRVATHWDFSGNITGYQNKSLFLIWEMPITQIFITAVFFICYKSIGWSKQQLSPPNPKSSARKNRVFRRVWSIYMTVFCIFMNIIFTMANFMIFSIFNINPKIFGFIIIAFIVIVFSSIIVISLKLGQGGANIKLPGEKIADSTLQTDKDDDSNWRFGNTIYYNPDDPSLFIEKRFGIGWTINAGRPAGMAIYIGLIVFIAIIIIICV
jgi:Predicted membrane protein